MKSPHPPFGHLLPSCGREKGLEQIESLLPLRSNGRRWPTGRMRADAAGAVDEPGIPLVNLGISCGMGANHPPSLGIKGGDEARMIPA